MRSLPQSPPASADPAPPTCPHTVVVPVPANTDQQPACGHNSCLLVPSCCLPSISRQKGWHWYATVTVLMCSLCQAHHLQALPLASQRMSSCLPEPCGACSPVKAAGKLLFFTLERLLNSGVSFPWHSALLRAAMAAVKAGP